METPTSLMQTTNTKHTTKNYMFIGVYIPIDMYLLCLCLLHSFSMFDMNSISFVFERMQKYLFFSAHIGSVVFPLVCNKVDDCDHLSNTLYKYSLLEVM